MNFPDAHLSVCVCECIHGTNAEHLSHMKADTSRMIMATDDVVLIIFRHADAQTQAPDIPLLSADPGLGMTKESNSLLIKSTQ